MCEAGCGIRVTVCNENDDVEDEGFSIVGATGSDKDF